MNRFTKQHWKIIEPCPELANRISKQIEELNFPWEVDRCGERNGDIIIKETPPLEHSFSTYYQDDHAQLTVLAIESMGWRGGHEQLSGFCLSAR